MKITICEQRPAECGFRYRSAEKAGEQYNHFRWRRVFRDSLGQAVFTVLMPARRFDRLGVKVLQKSSAMTVRGFRANRKPAATRDRQSDFPLP